MFFDVFGHSVHKKLKEPSQKFSSGPNDHSVFIKITKNYGKNNLKCNDQLFTDCRFNKFK